MQDEKSQLQNRVKAMRVLRARLYELEREKQQAQLAASRRSQIGTGERAEKIRTYNFAESRVTDHRIKLTLHRLDQVLDGEMGELTEALRAEEQRQALAVASREGRRALAETSDRLAAAGCDSPRVDAEILVSHVLGLSRSELALEASRKLSTAEAKSSTGWLSGERGASRGVRPRRVGIQAAHARRRPASSCRPETEVVVERAGANRWARRAARPRRGDGE